MRRPVGLVILWLVVCLSGGGWAAPRSVTFGGKVIDARGQPAGGAAVYVSLNAWSLPPNPPGTKPALSQTLAAADGSFRLELPVQADYWAAQVVAAKEGSGPGGLVVPPEMNAARLLIALTAPSFLAGRVVDGAGQ